MADVAPPEGSGVPVGTKYHWYVLAHQNTTKRSANDYTTSMTGLKFKIAHKRAGSEKWSATPRTQRKRMITFLRSVIADLEKQRDVAGDAMPARHTDRRPRTSRGLKTARRRRVGRVSAQRQVRRRRRVAQTSRA